MPLALVGTMFVGAPSFMAAGWVTRVNASPPQIGVGVSRNHATADAILDKRQFSVCLPNRNSLEKADFCGLCTAKETDKSRVFEVFFGELKAAPMIAECPLCMECALSKVVELPSNFFFIGDIRGVHADADSVEDGRLDPKKADSVFLTMPDNSYWSLGDKLGQAWRMGSRLRKPRTQPSKPTT